MSWVADLVQGTLSVELLMEVRWDKAKRTYEVSARANQEQPWSVFKGGEGEVDTLLALARDVMTGG
jgi:hypothetical protein